MAPESRGARRRADNAETGLEPSADDRAGRSQDDTGHPVQATVAKAAHTCVAHPDWLPGVRPGDDDRNDEIVAVCLGCQAGARQVAAIHALEDAPVDPEVDLTELLVDYPDELRRLQTEQARIARSPFYILAYVRGREYRDELLAAATRRGAFDLDAAADYFAEAVCTCASDDAVLLDETLDDPCVWCSLRVELEARAQDTRISEARSA